MTITSHAFLDEIGGFLNIRTVFEGRSGAAWSQLIMIMMVIVQSLRRGGDIGAKRDRQWP